MPQIANTYYGFDVVKISLSKIFWQFKPLDVRVDFYCDKDIKDIRVVEAVTKSWPVTAPGSQGVFGA
jgi:hypothetical protein